MRFFLIALIVMGCRKEEPTGASIESEPTSASASGVSGVAESQVQLDPSEALREKFMSEFKTCVSPADSMERCALTGPMKVEGMESFEILRESEGQDYFPKDVPVFIRIYYSYLDACKEVVVLKLLDGLDGFTSKVIPITEGVPAGCERRVKAIELKGNALWADEVKAYDRGLYLRFARLVEAVRTLHDKGFVHKFLAGANVRVERDDPDMVYLDHFELTQVLTDEPRLNRKADMLGLSIMLRMVPSIIPGWVRDFEYEMIYLADDARPDYEKWIEFCRSEASKMTE